MCWKHLGLVIPYDLFRQQCHVPHRAGSAKIKQIKDKIPNNPLDTLKKYNPTNNGASVKSRKPITEP